MEKITSFSVDHTKLNKGIYISRVDGKVTTYDIRMCAPYNDKPLDPKAAHTIEHIGASILRNSKYRNQVVYFGPMGCMTGFYLLTKGLSLEDVIVIVRRVFETIASWDQEIPGASKEECGNYTYMDLEEAKKQSKEFISHPWEHVYHYL